MSKIKSNPTGYVVYEGPSKFDGSPIVVIMLPGKSTNSKTGGMAQTYILRQDVPPAEAVRTGADAGICGTCQARGRIVPIDTARAMLAVLAPGAHKRALRAGIKRAERIGADTVHYGRSCYVTLAHGPRAVYAEYRAGKYPRVTPAQAAKLILGRRLRLGTYGDPAAAPIAMWRALLAFVSGHTGYSHAWRTAHKAWADIVMASADSADDVAAAVARGYRTFRVRSADQPILAGEITCPASDEAGKRTTCEQCGLCAGTAARTSKTIVIQAHGTGASAFALA